MFYLNLSSETPSIVLFPQKYKPAFYPVKTDAETQPAWRHDRSIWTFC